MLCSLSVDMTLLSQDCRVIVGDTLPLTTKYPGVLSTQLINLRNMKVNLKSTLWFQGWESWICNQMP